MSKIEHILSVINYTIYGAVCFQFTHFPFDDGENIYTLSYHHHQIGSMNYYPLFRVRSWNNGVRCMSFYILINYNLLNYDITPVGGSCVGTPGDSSHLHECSYSTLVPGHWGATVWELPGSGILYQSLIHFPHDDTPFDHLTTHQPWTDAWTLMFYFCSRSQHNLFHHSWNCFTN